MKLEPKYSVEAIGKVRSCFKQKFGTPRQPGKAIHAVAELEIFPSWQPELSLRGLEKFSHLWVIFWFHENGGYKFHAKIHPPRLKGESVGVFASRSPHRPNPIGLSVLKILKVMEKSVLVTGVDLIEGTPILDMKPYLTHIESLPEAQDGWVDDNPEQRIQVSWVKEILEVSFTEWFKKSEEVQHFGLRLDEVQTLIEQIIAEDPRPLVYRGFEGGESQYRNTHAFYLFDADIQFRFTSPDKAEIFSLVYK